MTQCHSAILRFAVLPYFDAKKVTTSEMRLRSCVVTSLLVLCALSVSLQAGKVQPQAFIYRVLNYWAVS